MKRDNSHTSGKGRRRPKLDTFTVVSTLAACVAIVFIGSAVLAILLGGIAHLGEAVTSAEVLFALRLSFVTSTISTIICLVIALPASYALTHFKLPGKRAVEILLELTLSLPYILLGFALLIIFSSPFGKMLKEIGLAIVFQPAGIVFAQLIVNLPFALRMVRTAIMQVNPRVEFVAKTLGASRWNVFRTIILPLCRNSIISTFVLTWARGMGEFGATLMLVGVTRMKTETLPGSIYLSISTGNTDTAMATAIIMLMVSALTLAISNVLNKNVGPSRVDGKRRFGSMRSRREAIIQESVQEDSGCDVAVERQAPVDGGDVPSRSVPEEA